MPRGGKRDGAGRPRVVIGETYAQRYYRKYKEQLRIKRKGLLHLGRMYRRTSKYGITKAQFDELLASQKFVCAICRKPETLKQKGNVQSLSVDHCHQTGRIRGLICNDCNIMLGRAKDDVDTLKAAIDYLNRC